MSRLNLDEVAETMLRARLEHDGLDQDTIDRRVQALMNFPENFPELYGYDDTFDIYLDQARLIIDWIEDNEPEARAVASLVLEMTPDHSNFDDGLIEDALSELQFKIGDVVRLTALPAGLLDDLPAEDQLAILAVIDKPVLFAGREGDEAILRFVDDEGDEHMIWVDSKLVKAASDE